MAIRLQPNARRLVVIGRFVKIRPGMDRETRAAELPRCHPEHRDNLLDGAYRSTSSSSVLLISLKTRILLVLTVSGDRTGRNFIPREALARIAATAGAPAYGPYATYIGYGIVGGNTVTFESIGAAVAGLAVDALAGKPIVNSRGTDRRGRCATTRALGIGRGRPSAGHSGSFQEKVAVGGVLAELIVGVIAVVALQGLVITGLLLERRRRRVAEMQSRLRLLEVVHLNQSATAGALSASIAHELNQPLGAIRSNAEAAEVAVAERDARPQAHPADRCRHPGRRPARRRHHLAG